MSRESDMCRKCRNLLDVTMENGHNWKGGKTNHSKGYILQKTRNHPKASSAGYVLQHILVMEESIGRYLFDKETVHHKNGFKDDNRIENLELWCSSHPGGQRVVDLVDWAKSILERYGKNLE